MAARGKYCQAYSIKNLREFSGRIERFETGRMEKQKGADGKEVEIARTLPDNDYLYLQQNYVVTDGIFKDESIIFGQVTPE